MDWKGPQQGEMVGYFEHGVKFGSQLNNYHLRMEDVDKYVRQHKKHVLTTYSRSTFNW
jgi:hypothetical protein